MRKIKSTLDMERADWLELRRSGIGGSDAAAIIGLNPYRSEIDVWMDKTGKKKSDDYDSEAMRLGRDLEEYVAKRWEESTGKTVRRNNFFLAHDDYDFITANIDREVVGEKAILECKTASPYMVDKWKDGEVPPQYVVQCLHYLAVTGYERCYLACLIYGRGIELRVIERDEDTIQALIKSEINFWKEYVEKDIMPPPDGSDSAGKAIKELYVATEDGKAIDLDSEAEEKLKRLDEIKELTDKLDKEKKGIEQKIQLEMKDAETAYAGTRKITWKSQVRKDFDKISFKKDHPDLYPQYEKEGKPFRVLKVYAAR